MKRIELGWIIQVADVLVHLSNRYVEVGDNSIKGGSRGPSTTGRTEGSAVPFHVPEVSAANIDNLIVCRVNRYHGANSAGREVGFPFPVTTHVVRDP